MVQSVGHVLLFKFSEVEFLLGTIDDELVVSRLKAYYYAFFKDYFLPSANCVGVISEKEMKKLNNILKNTVRLLGVSKDVENLANILGSYSFGSVDDLNDFLEKFPFYLLDLPSIASNLNGDSHMRDLVMEDCLPYSIMVKAFRFTSSYDENMSKRFNDLLIVATSKVSTRVDRVNTGALPLLPLIERRSRVILVLMAVLTQLRENILVSYSTP